MDFYNLTSRQTLINLVEKQIRKFVTQLVSCCQININLEINKISLDFNLMTDPKNKMIIFFTLY